jgi:O-methyltransferase
MEFMIRRFVKRAVRSFGYEIVRRPTTESARLPADVSAEDRVILEAIAPFTMTSVERQLALIQSVRYVVRNHIPGCFVECGVWRGGSAMAAALTLAQEGDRDRELFLFDTFEGMTEPTSVDRSFDGASARTMLRHSDRSEDIWCYADIADVRSNLMSTGYPEHKIKFVKGPVEQTIPISPSMPLIALLRLDTDWYESTKHELLHLFPLLQPGGILIVDDYGHWQGARRAVDEYLSSQRESYFLHRIDYTGRLIVKHASPDVSQTVNVGFRP